VERERESRAELDRLGRSLSASERDAQLLTARLETTERELAEAEQAAAAERAEAQRVAAALRSRVTELDGRAGELQQLLELERIARERAEHALEQLGAAQRSAQVLLGGLAETVARLRDAAARPSPPAEPAAIEPSRAVLAPVSAPEPPAAIPQTPPLAPPARAPQAPRSQPKPAAGSAGEAQAGEMAESLAAAFERLRARVEQQEEAPAITPSPSHAARQPHKHSMSLIGRTRLAMRRRSERRKQRRAA
jgi:hypothetical protein